MSNAKSISAALADAISQLKPIVDNVLSNEVFKVVQNEEVRTIYSTVYSHKDPFPDYVRRYDEGGIGDESNIKIIGGKASNGRLAVYNSTPPNPEPRDVATTAGKSLDMIIETGVGYDFGSPGARPFTANTVAALAGNKRHVGALEMGLLMRGVDVR